MVDAVLSHYPFSQPFRSRLEARLGDVPGYLSLAELRELPVKEIWKRLRSVKAERILIPLEDEGARAVLPFLKMIAAASSAGKIEIINSDLQHSPASRWSLMADALSVGAASVRGRSAAATARREIKSLLKSPRIDVSLPDIKRVLYVNANLWFGVRAGGSIGHVAGVANAMAERGYEVTYASVGENPMLSAQIKRMELQPPLTFAFPLEYTQYSFDRSARAQLSSIMSEQYRFIYQRLSLGNFTGVYLSRRHALPYVLEYNGSEAWAAKNWGRPLRNHGLAVSAEDVCLKHAHLVVTISEVLKDELLARGVEANRIVCYPNCVDERVFDPSRFTSVECAELRARYGIAPDALVVGFVGTFGAWHGVEVLAQAVRKLACEETAWLRQKKIHFLIIGDGPRMPAVKKILGEFRPEFWTLTGLVPQAETPRHLAASDILVSPHVSNQDGSRFFGSPTKLFEYMAMGKAIVASDLDQIGEVLKNSLLFNDLRAPECKGTETSVALLCRPGDVDQLVGGIRFLAEHPCWRSLLGRNVRREALAKYTWKTHVGKILGAVDGVQGGAA